MNQDPLNNRHLSEEELIDVLMNEPHDPALRQHLDTCDICAEQLGTLDMGLQAARSIKPQMPLTAVPVISYEKFDKAHKHARMSWIALAAMFFLALTGLRFQVGQDGLTIQFALFHGSQSQAAEERIAALEDRLYEALEVQGAMAQDQIDKRFNAFFMDYDQNMGEFSTAVSNTMSRAELINEQRLLKLEKELLRQERMRSKGKMQ